jgi:sterol carrier protein 2
MNSPVQHKYLTKLQCCPTSDGAAAVIVVSDKFLAAHPELRSQAVEIVAQALATDDVAQLGGSDMELIGAEMTRVAARKVYEQGGITPQDVQVVELHDCFSANEMYRPRG